MQTVKCYSNKQLKKNEGPQFRKIKPQGNIARKLNNGPQSRVPLRVRGCMGNTMASRHQGTLIQGCSNAFPCNIQSKEETAEKREAKDQVPRTCLIAEYV